MTPRMRFCEIVEFLCCSVNVCHGFVIVGAAINFGLIHHGVELRDSKLIADGRAWRVDGRALALVGPGLATPLIAI